MISSSDSPGTGSGAAPPESIGRKTCFGVPGPLKVLGEGGEGAGFEGRVASDLTDLNQPVREGDDTEGEEEEGETGERGEGEVIE